MQVNHPLARARRAKWQYPALHREYRRLRKSLQGEFAQKSLLPDSLTVTITSAGRLAELRKTIESMQEHLDVSGFQSVHWTIIDDDPDDDATRQYIQGLGLFDKVLLNPTNLRLGRSLNRIWSQVETEYVFSTEDDWVHLRDLPVREMTGYLQGDFGPAAQVLACREPVREPEREYRGAKQLAPGIAERNGHYSFNPHVFRTQYYLEHGPVPVFSRVEEDYAAGLRRTGKARSLIFGYGQDPYIRHIGYESKLTNMKWGPPADSPHPQQP